MTDRLTKSKDFTEEYCCSVVRVGELEPVENSDNLMRTVVNGERIVVNKQDVKQGDETFVCTMQHYVRELEEYVKESKGKDTAIPDWAHKLMKDRYGMKLHG